MRYQRRTNPYNIDTHPRLHALWEEAYEAGLEDGYNEGSDAGSEDGYNQAYTELEDRFSEEHDSIKTILNRVLAPEDLFATDYLFLFSRRDLVLYLAWEYGTRGAARLMRGLKPFGNSNEPYPNPPERSQGNLWRFKTVHHGRRAAEHIRQAVAWQRGRLGLPNGADVY